MTRLLRLEILKLSNYRPFWFFVAMHVLLMFLVVGSIGKFAGSAEVNQIPIPDLFAYPGIWHHLAYLSRWFYYLLGFLIILVMSNEIEVKAMRQQVMFGLERWQIFAGRVGFILTITGFALTTIIIFALIFGKSSPGQPMITGHEAQMLIVFVLQGAGYLGFAMFLITYIQRAVLAAGIFIVWPLIVEPLSGWILDGQLGLEVSKWLPFHVVSGLVPTPAVMEPVAGAAISSGIVLASIGYCGLIYGLCFLRMQRQDI